MYGSVNRNKLCCEQYTPFDPNEEPVLDYIDDDDEYEAVADAFDEYLDNCEFDEIIEADEEETADGE